MFQKHFKRTFCINLDRRGDRIQSFYADSKKIGFDYERVGGVDGQTLTFKNPLNIPHFHPGDVGCTLSHLKTLERAMDLKLDNYLVFEDDVLFRDGFIYLYNKFIDQVPQDWDMIYFGANHDNTEPIRITENVSRVVKAYTTHAIAIKSTMFEDLKKVWSEPVQPVDVLLSFLHSKYNVYCFQPNICGQKSGYSDILGKEVNYDFLIK